MQTSLSLLVGAAVFIQLTVGGIARAGEPMATAVGSAAKIFMDDPWSVGLSVGVIQGDASASFSFGSVDRGGSDSPSERTIYPIASITKTFTGTLLAVASTEGKLKLGDDVRALLKPGFPNLEFEGHPIRVHDLLNHRSGLPFMLPDRPDLMPGYQGEPITKHLERSALALATYSKRDFFSDLHLVKLTSVPGKRFQYSNAAAQLAGYVLEDLYRTSFEELVTAKICRPLGMSDTGIKLSSSQRTRLAPGHDGDGTVLPPPRNELQAAGALKSTVTDLLKYLRWHIVETSQAVQLSHAPTFTEGNYAVGLNWQMLTANGRRLIWQEGNIPGYTSYLLFEPELNLGLVILTNESDPTSSPRIAAMANRILEALDSRAIPVP